MALCLDALAFAQSGCSIIGEAGLGPASPSGRDVERCCQGNFSEGHIFERNIRVSNKRDSERNAARAPGYWHGRGL